MNEPQLIPCFLCGNGIELRYSKRDKPYLICDPCGIQIFIRGKRGIKLLSQLGNSLKGQNATISSGNHLEITALANRLTELRAHLEKMENDNLLNMFLEKNDPVAEALNGEIRKIEAQLRKFAVNETAS